MCLLPRKYFRQEMRVSYQSVESDEVEEGMDSSTILNLVVQLAHFVL